MHLPAPDIGRLIHDVDGLLQQLKALRRQRIVPAHQNIDTTALSIALETVADHVRTFRATLPATDAHDPIVNLEAQRATSTGVTEQPPSTLEPVSDPQLNTRRLTGLVIDGVTAAESTAGLRPSLVCSVQDLRHRTVSVLQRFTKAHEVRQTGVACARVDGLSNIVIHEEISFGVDVEKRSIRVDADRDRILHVVSTVTRLADTVVLPKGSWDHGIPTVMTNLEMREHFESAAQNISEEAVPSLSVSSEGMGCEYTPLLSSKGGLESKLEIGLAESISVIPLRCRPGAWASVDLMMKGAPKIWLIIAPAATSRLREKLQEQFPESPCTARLLHLNLLLPPHLLDLWGIDYSLRLCRAGEMLVTTDAHYQGLSLGLSLSETIDIMADPPLPISNKAQIFCAAHACGSDQTIPRCARISCDTTDHEGPTTAPPPKCLPHKRLRSYQAERAAKRQVVELKSTNTWMRKLECLDLGSGLKFVGGGEPPDGMRLAASILSKVVFDQLFTLICAWRTQRACIGFLGKVADGYDRAARIAVYDQRVQSTQKQALIHLYIQRVNEYRFANEMVQAKGARERHDHRFIEQVLTNMGADPMHKPSRRTLMNNFARRNKWLTLCKTFGSGLLTLIPFTIQEPYFISTDVCHKMTEKAIQLFHLLVETPQAHETLLQLCCIGEIIQEMFQAPTAFEFEFELHQSRLRQPSFNTLTVPASFALFRPAQYLKENRYSMRSPWPEPDGWEGDWPADPTRVDADCPCFLCNNCQCACVPTTHMDRHHIVSCGAKGRGIQARAPVAGGIAFKKDACIGELTGQLEPLETPANSYGMARLVHRPDIPGSPAVCQLVCTEHGNWLRLLNHACRPCTVFEEQVVGGRVRVLVRAVREIMDGEEITVHYGSGYFSHGSCMCDDCIKVT
jgi:hypothetical protein